MEDTGNNSQMDQIDFTVPVIIRRSEDGVKVGFRRYSCKEDQLSMNHSRLKEQDLYWLKAGEAIDNPMIPPLVRQLIRNVALIK